MIQHGLCHTGMWKAVFPDYIELTNWIWIILTHKSCWYSLSFGSFHNYIFSRYTLKNFISEKGFKFHFSLSFQDLTNFRSSSCGCYFWNIERAEHSFLCFTNFSFALLQCPFAQLALKCSLFILFCNSFVPSMHCKIIYWLSNPLSYLLIIVFTFIWSMYW